MASNSDAGATPANVAAKATIAGVLDRHEVSLIGVFGSDSDMKAMVRLPGGRIKAVRTGARLAQGRVVGIDAEGLMLQVNGRIRRLALPSG
ncbi:MAG: hypothetical protein ACK5MY_14875 [Jhaorihella sp.]